MPKLSTQANKFYPNLPEITQEPESHSNALMQIKSALQTHERRDGDYLKSFVRFEELVTLGIIDEEGEFILSALQLGAGTLGGLSDVSISGVADNNILGYDVGTSTWLNQTPSQLGVVEEAPTDGIDYVRNNSAWVASSGSGTNDHLLLANIGINTHPQIDAHLGDVSIHTEDILLVHKAGTEVITGVKQFEGLTFFTADLNISNNIAINWDDGSGTNLEMLVLEQVVPGGAPPVDPDLASVTLLITAEDTNAGATAFVSDIGGHAFNTVFGGNGAGGVNNILSKFGNNSLHVNASGNGLNFARWLGPAGNADFLFGSGDFTIEMHYLAQDNLSSTVGVMSVSDNFVQRAWDITIGTAAGNFQSGFRFSTDGAAGGVNIASTPWGVGVLNTWYHIAVVRDGTTLRMFIEGVQLNTAAIPASDSMFASNQAIAIDAFQSNSGNGNILRYFDNIRITKGVARYTANFTPPTAPFDGSSGANTYTVGDPSVATQIDGATVSIGAPVDITGDLVITGVVDGRDVALDGTVQDTHIADATIHFTEASIDHVNILNIGTNSHATIDTHIADATIHFPQVVTSTTVALEDITNAVNTSGDKVAGYLVFNPTTNAPVWATGAADGDVWNDASGVVAHTPI